MVLVRCKMQRYCFFQLKSVNIADLQGDDYEYPPAGGNHHPGTYNRNEYGSLSQYNDNEAAMASWGLGSTNYNDAGVLDAKDQPAYSSYGQDDKRVVSFLFFLFFFLPIPPSSLSLRASFHRTVLRYRGY